MKTWMWIGIGAVILVLAIIYTSAQQPTVVVPDVASSTPPLVVTPVATSTATSTAAAAAKPAPKPTPPAQVSAVWTQYLKAFACEKISLLASAKVNSFRQEGMSVVVGTQQAYKCNNGHTWVY